MRLALVALLLTVPTVASADAIAILPCMPGWRSTNTGHSVYCAPISCTSAAECGGGTCGEVARCTRTRPVDVGNGLPSDPPASYEEPTTTLCTADGSCAADMHCARARECTPPPPPPPSASSCGVAHARPSAWWLALVVGLALRRRRS